MSTINSGLELASEDWQLAGDDGAKKPTSLVVQLRRRAYVLPYFRLIYAEGDNGLVKIAFASHLVTVTGHGLAALIAVLAMNAVARIIQPTENEARFGVRGPASAKHSGPSITDISVEEFKQ
jgi:hypothetical protein